MRVVYLHGWPDGSIDTATAADELRRAGLDLLEISVEEPIPTHVRDVVLQYASQIPDEIDDFVLIGYCAAGGYAMFLDEHLTAMGRPPKALLLLELVELSGSKLIYGGFDRLGNMPPKVQLQRQLLRTFPPFDEGFRAVLKDWLRVKAAPRARLLRLLGRKDVIKGRSADWASIAYTLPLSQQLSRPTKRTVVSYLAARPMADRYGPAGPMARNYLGPVAVRTFEGMDHDNVIERGNIKRIARVMAEDVASIAAGEPIMLSLSFPAPSEDASSSSAAQDPAPHEA
jgi:hypothetical protein